VPWVPSSTTSSVQSWPVRRTGSGAGPTGRVPPGGRPGRLGRLGGRPHRHAGGVVVARGAWGGRSSDWASWLGRPGRPGMPDDAEEEPDNQPQVGWIAPRVPAAPPAERGRPERRQAPRNKWSPRRRGPVTPGPLVFRSRPAGWHRAIVGPTQPSEPQLGIQWER